MTLASSLRILIRSARRQLRSPFSRLRTKTLAVKHFRQWTPWDQKALEFYAQFIPSGAICIDVGANVGNRTKVFVRLAAKVIAVEPQEDCLSVLRRLRAQCDNLVLDGRALGAAPGIAQLHISDNSTLSTLSSDWIKKSTESKRFGESPWRKTTAISMSTLDAIIAEHGTPAFVKIDVEGYEREVLAGLTKPVPYISFEFVPERLDVAFACLNEIKRLGSITANFALNEDLELCLPTWLDLESFQRCLSSRPFARSDFGDIYVKVS